MRVKRHWLLAAYGAHTCSPRVSRVTGLKDGRMRRLHRGTHLDTRARGCGGRQRTGARNRAAGTRLREAPVAQHRRISGNGVSQGNRTWPWRRDRIGEHSPSGACLERNPRTPAVLRFRRSVNRRFSKNHCGSTCVLWKDRFLTRPLVNLKPRIAFVESSRTNRRFPIG